MDNGVRGLHVYCTYFDSAYLARGIQMVRSLLRFRPGAAILVLALDDLCARVLRETFAGAVRVVDAETLAAACPALREARSKRSVWAYYATQKPALIQYAMQCSPQPTSVMFLDADTWFFSDPAPMFEEIGHASVALSPHRFHAATRHLARYGQYNAGCIYWRSGDTGWRSVADWLADCLKWCSEEPQADGRFMNQGYLNCWPERYPGVHILQHPGINLAPWNLDGHQLERRGDSVLVDGLPLIFFHFHALSRDPQGQWYSHFPHLERQFDLAFDAIYRPHMDALEQERSRLLEDYGLDGTGSVRPMSDWPAVLHLSASRSARA